MELKKLKIIIAAVVIILFILLAVILANSAGLDVFWSNLSKAFG